MSAGKQGVAQIGEDIGFGNLMLDVKIYDTTLRDGSQGEGISFSLDDKIKIACKLDYLGNFIISEGGWPAAIQGFGIFPGHAGLQVGKCAVGCIQFHPQSGCQCGTGRQISRIYLNPG